MVLTFESVKISQHFPHFNFRSFTSHRVNNLFLIAFPEQVCGMRARGVPENKFMQRSDPKAQGTMLSSLRSKSR